MTFLDSEIFLEKNRPNFKKGIDTALTICYNIQVVSAGMAQSVEHVIGNDEVISSILITSSKTPCTLVHGVLII